MGKAQKSGDDDEHGYKWWVKVAIIPVLVVAIPVIVSYRSSVAKNEIPKSTQTNQASNPPSSVAPEVLSFNLSDDSEAEEKHLLLRQNSGIVTAHWNVENPRGMLSLRVVDVNGFNAPFPQLPQSGFKAMAVGVTEDFILEEDGIDGRAIRTLATARVRVCADLSNRFESFPHYRLSVFCPRTEGETVLMYPTGPIRDQVFP